MVWRIDSLDNLSSRPVSLRDCVVDRDGRAGPAAGPAVTIQPQRTWSDPVAEWRESCCVTFVSASGRNTIVKEVRIVECISTRSLGITCIAGSTEVDTLRMECPSLYPAPDSPMRCPCLRLTFGAHDELQVTLVTHDGERTQVMRTAAVGEPGLQDGAEPGLASSSAAGLMTPSMQSWQNQAAGAYRAHRDFSVMRASGGARGILDSEGSSSEDSEGEEDLDDEDDTVNAAAALAAAATATLELEVVLNAILAEALGAGPHGTGRGSERPHRFPTTLSTEAASRALARFLNPRPIDARSAPSVPPPPRVDLSGPPCVECQACTYGPAMQQGCDYTLKAFLLAAAQLMPKLMGPDMGGPEHGHSKDGGEKDAGRELPNMANSTPRGRGEDEGDPMEETVKNQVCVLCLSPFSEPTTLPCGHAFCRGCIHVALAHQAACPVCRAPARAMHRLRPINMALSEILEATAMPRATPEAVAKRERALLEAAECPMCKAPIRDPVTSPCGHSTCRKCCEAALRVHMEKGPVRRPEHGLEEEEAAGQLESQDPRLEDPPTSPTSSAALRDSLAAAEARMRDAQRMGAAALAAAARGQHVAHMITDGDTQVHDGIAVVDLEEEERQMVRVEAWTERREMPPPRAPSQGWVGAGEEPTVPQSASSSCGPCRCTIS